MPLRRYGPLLSLFPNPSIGERMDPHYPPCSYLSHHHLHRTCFSVKSIGLFNIQYRCVLHIFGGIFPQLCEART
ncbi:hypothetical protein J4Q44_G00023590, partial [Coregonus suidteri]